jgi:transposase InsO family protein
VARSGFYVWLKREFSKRKQEDERFKIAVKAAHRRTRETDGTRRLPSELASDGFIVGRDSTGEGWRCLAAVKDVFTCELLAQFGMQISMSRKGNGYDNAPMESFWGSLKNECVYPHHYATRAQAIASIREYIEIFYNRQRRHSRLGNLAPSIFAERFGGTRSAV